jgi:hypothetical protein
MNDNDLEPRLRASLTVVDDARIDPPATVAAAVERAQERRRRHHRHLLMVTAVSVLAAIAVPLAIGTRSHQPPRTTRVVTGPSTAATAATSTPTAPTPTPAPAAVATTTTEAGTGGTWRALPGDPRATVYDSDVVWTG